jgi:hypothetical protein
MPVMPSDYTKDVCENSNSPFVPVVAPIQAQQESKLTLTQTRKSQIELIWEQEELDHPIPKK